MPITMAGRKAHHAVNPMPQFAFTQPPTLGSNVPATSAPWDWATTSMGGPIHARPAVADLNMANPPYYGYDNYPVLHEIISGHGGPYGQSPLEAPYSTTRDRSPTMLGSQSLEEHGYDANTPELHADLRRGQNPVYRF